MELLGESLVISLLVGLIVAWPLRKIVRLIGFGAISTVVAGVLGIMIGIWITPGARDIIPAVIDLPLPKLPTLKLPVAAAPPPEVSESDLLSWAPAPFELAMQPMAQLRPMMKPIVYRSREEVCASLAEAIRNNDLPPHFFIRLLYQESSFRPYVISSAGALGIAQFMPETANERGLDNPFDPAQAIPASARLLRDLSRKFGNLGLAAAAYNAGPKRIQDWLANKSPLPQETQDYVRNITSWPAATWTGSQQAGSPAVRLPQQAPCQELAGLLAWNGPDAIPMPAPNPLVIVARQVKLAKLAQRAARGKKPHTDGEAAKQVHDSKADAKTDGKTDGKTDDNVDAKADSKSDAKTAGKTDGKSSKSNSVVRN
jgi:Transglycosylase SLT domain